MPDEVSPPTTEAPASTPSPPAAAAAAATETAVPGAAPADAPKAEEGATWHSAIESVSAEDLRRHPRIAGIVGELSQRQRAQWERERTEEIRRTQAEEAEAKLLKMAQEDPVEFASRFLTDHQQAKLQRDLADVHIRTQSQMAEAIGKAVAEIAEYKDLSEEDFQAIASALAGKPDPEVLPIYTRSVIDRLVKRSTAKAVEAEVAKRLEAEKKAYRQEWEAERLAAERAPDMKGGTRRGPVDPLKLPDDQFDEWYEKSFRPSFTSRRR